VNLKKLPNNGRTRLRTINTST